MSVKLKKSAQYSLHSTMLVDQIMQIKNTQLMTHLSFSQYFFFFFTSCNLFVILVVFETTLPFYVKCFECKEKRCLNVINYYCFYFLISNLI